MSEKIKIGILGYGNLAKGVESAIAQNEDMELAAVYTRRDPASVRIRKADVPVKSSTALDSGNEAIDVLIICGGSATDLPVLTPKYAKLYNVVDSFDTHANIPEHFRAANEAAKAASKLALISCGWDPGMFSLNRLYMNCVLPEGKDYTFWGRGVSQGHSDAIRRIEGVQDARQYTVPKEEALSAVRSGKSPELSTRQKHLRECFVALKKEADNDSDKKRIEEEIKSMPNYFADYDTTVTFISVEEMEKNHSGLPHGGFVIRNGVSGFEKEHNHTIEYSLKLGSNPEFTGSVLVSFARAVSRLSKENRTGAITVFDVAPAYLSPLSGEEIRGHLL